METLITTHARADFDALASAVAAQKIYPDSAIVLPGMLNSNVRNFINLYRDFLPLIESAYLAPSYNLLVVVDTRQRQRLKHISNFLEKEIQIHVYDHHPHQADDISGDWERVEEIGATTTLLVEEIKDREIILTELEATIMALGIYEDTGYLAFNTTTARDVEAFAYLWRLGINTEMVQEFFQSPLTSGQKSLFESLISQSEFMEINQRKVLCSLATSEEYIHGVAELLHRIASIEEAEAAFCLVSMEDKIHMIARAYRDDIDLLKILSFWKVKGHPRAVSASLKDVSLEQARRDLMDALHLSLPFPLRARDIASSPVKTIDINARAAEAIDLLDNHGHSGLVVVEDRKIAGIISRKDLYKAQQHQLEHAPVKAFMSKKVITASPETSVGFLRNLMIEYNIGRVPIVEDPVDAEGMVGIVTRKDILRSLYHIDAARNDTFVVSHSPCQSLPKDDGDDETAEDQGKDLNIAETDDLTLLISRVMPAEFQKILYIITRAAESEGCQVYLVGGCIRDMLLGLSLPADLDLAVTPDALSFARRLNEELQGKLQLFEPFGTAAIFLEKGMRLDLVTARSEIYVSPAAPPQVEASSLKNDLFRRDFTINTLACSLNTGSFGKVYDFFGGRKDLQAGVIRVLYHLSFVDDPLRILRAIRFEQRFNFYMADETVDFLKKAVKKRLLKKVSRGRLSMEVRLIFGEPNPPAVLQRLEEFNILTQIFPRIRPNYRTWNRLESARESLRWAENREWERTPDPEITYLSAFFFGLPPERVRFLGIRLGYSRHKVQRMVAAACELPGVIKKLSEEQMSPSRVYQLLEPLPVEALLLLRALAPDSRVRELPQLYWDHLCKVQPALDGHHLKEMGFPPGPIYGEILQKLREAIMEGRIRSVEDERNFVLSYLKEGTTSGDENGESFRD